VKCLNLIIFLFLSIMTLISEAQDRSELPPIGISNVIKHALATLPQALIALENVEFARMGIESSRAELLPVASANYNFSANQNPISLGRGEVQIGSSGFSVSQSLINLPSVFAYRAAKERLNTAISNADGDAIKIASQAAISYVDVLKLRITLDLAAEHFEFISDLIKSIKEGDLKGRATENDLTMVVGAWGTAKSDQSHWTEEADKAENNFFQNSNVTAKDYFLVLPETLTVPTEVVDAIETALQKNPGLLAAHSRIQVAGKDVAAAKSTYLPRVDVVGSAYYVNRPVGDFKQLKMGGASVGIAVAVPLFDKKRGALVGTQKVKQRISNLQLEAETRSLTNNLKNVYVQNKQHKEGLNGLCHSLRNRLTTVESMRQEVLTKYTVQDLLKEKLALVKTAVDLNNELLSEVLDSYNVQVQMGTLMDNLPEPIDTNMPKRPNPQLKGMESYQGLLDQCEGRRL